MAEVDLVFRSGITINDPHRRGAAIPTPIRGEPDQRTIRNHDPLTAQQNMNLGDRQRNRMLLRTPFGSGRDLINQRHQRFSRLTMTIGPHRTNPGHHRRDQLRRPRRRHVPSDRLAIDARMCGDRRQPRRRQPHRRPQPQHFPDLLHSNLPVAMPHPLP